MACGILTVADEIDLNPMWLMYQSVTMADSCCGVGWGGIEKKSSSVAHVLMTPQSSLWLSPHNSMQMNCAEISERLQRDGDFLMHMNSLSAGMWSKERAQKKRKKTRNNGLECIKKKKKIAGTADT